MTRHTRGQTPTVTPGAAVRLVIAALVGMLAISAPLAAHSGLGAASPAPGSVVGGDINEIQLRYNSSVAEVSGSVTAPGGTVLDTTFVHDSVLAITIELSAPLSLPGEYAVRHSSLSVDDGDRVDAAYLFTYDPTAAPPQLEILEADDGGISAPLWIIIAVGAVAIGVLTWRLVAAARRVRGLRTSD